MLRRPAAVLAALAGWIHFCGTVEHQIENFLRTGVNDFTLDRRVIVAADPALSGGSYLERRRSAAELSRDLRGALSRRGGRAC